MKKLLLLFVLGISLGQLSAQVDTVHKQSYTSKIDSAFAPLLSDSIPYDILYDRVFPWAGLRSTSSGDTIDFSLLKQAWYELELSRTSTKFTKSYTSYNNLRDTAYATGLKNRIQVAAIAVKMASIDTMAFTDGRLDSTTAGWDKAAGQASPFNIHNVTMSAVSMHEYVIRKEYTLEMKSEHLKNTDRSGIQSIEITEPVNDIDITLVPGQLTTFTVSDTGQFYLTIQTNFNDGSHFINKQHTIVKDSVDLRSDCVTKQVIESDIVFQGIDETEATTSLADVYFYYHYDENGDCEEFLDKPIIICDGFDPLDGRPIGEIESMFKFNNQNDNAIEELRKLGFDVIIMNFPVIGSDAINNRKYVTNNHGNPVDRDTRDGGTDYTQRNAFLMVKLIQMVNEQLETNGSDEELSIIGPSMGGQVTRYALAYMEEQKAAGVPNMDHNTRVWISFDSPHHGANIPIGNTGLLSSLGYTLNQTDAIEKFEDKVATNAGQQYLINQAIPEFVFSPFFNFYTTIFYQNNTSPRRIQYMKDLALNGLPGSAGWPQKVKRVAIANSSDKGITTGTAGEEALYIKVPEIRIPIIGPFVTIPVGVAEFQSFLQEKYQDTNDPLYKALLSDIGWIYFSQTSVEVSLENKNPPGSIDILPGSMFNSTQEVSDGIIEGLKKRGIKAIDNRIKPDHTFMPVISTLAFNDTDIDWAQRLDNRNLVCTGEIPFDAYMISGGNQDHITITEDIFNYIKHQVLYGKSGCAPLCGYSISGDKKICDSDLNRTYTYNLSGVGVDEQVEWVVDGHLLIQSESGNELQVKISRTSGFGQVTAVITNTCGEKIERTLHINIGEHQLSLTSDFHENEAPCRFTVTAHPARADIYEWSTDGDNYVQGSRIEEFTIPQGQNGLRVYAKADWGCGYSTASQLLIPPSNSKCDIFRSSQAEEDEFLLSNQEGSIIVSPNPTSGSWNVHLSDAEAFDNISLYDAFGNQISHTSTLGLKRVEIGNKSLSPGTYFIRLENEHRVVTSKCIKMD